MDPAVVYKIERFGIPYAAGFWKNNSSFLQVFPIKQVYRHKVDWIQAWSIWGDEVITATWRRPSNTTHDYPTLAQTSAPSQASTY